MWGRGERSSLIHNPVRVKIKIAKAVLPADADAKASRSEKEVWTVTTSLTAYPAPHQRKIAKNLLFLVDTSDSMNWDINDRKNENNRINQVKKQIPRLLKQLEPDDSFCIVTFQSEAKALADLQEASPGNIQTAEAAIAEIAPTGSTNFRAAFRAAQEKLQAAVGDYDIIFLTDGEHAARLCPPDFEISDLSTIFSSGYMPRIIPIGVYQKNQQQRNLLDEIARLSTAGKKRPITQALYIDSDDDNAYQNAFDAAFANISESSVASAQLAMSIKAGSEEFKNTGKGRSIGPVLFNGLTQNEACLAVDFIEPPKHFGLQMRCDGAYLEAAYELTAAQLEEFQSNGAIEIPIDKFRYKDTSCYSWFLTLGSIAVGSILLTAFALYAFPLVSPILHLNLYVSLAIKAIDAWIGAGLCLYGVHSFTRKTIFLPTKRAHVKEEGTKEAKSNPQQVSVIPTVPSAVHEGRLLSPAKKIFWGSLFAGVGAPMGCYLGLTPQASAMATWLATSITLTPSLFLTACSIGGAVLLPLLAYVAWIKVTSSSSNENTSSAMHLR